LAGDGTVQALFRPQTVAEHGENPLRLRFTVRSWRDPQHARQEGQYIFGTAAGINVSRGFAGLHQLENRTQQRPAGLPEILIRYRRAKRVSNPVLNFASLSKPIEP
jgi:hypothetical protein